MKNVKVLILEKNLILANQLMYFLELLGYLVISKATSIKKALLAINKEKPDFVLTHIANTKNENWNNFNDALVSVEGLHLIILIPSLEPRFILNEPDKPSKSYMVFPEVGYFDRASREISSLINHQQGSNEIWVKKGTRHERVKIEDILWIEAREAYCEIMVEGDIPYLLSCKLKTVHEILAHPKIMRVHRSFSVNLDKIDAFEGNTLFIKEKAIPIGKTYKEAFIRNFPTIIEQGCVIKSQPASIGKKYLL